MISFFRKIRQSLLDSSATKKYILYAIGEILLVMIGILLALQVNNWNEARKSRIEDRNFLLSLKTELIADTTEFRSRVMYYQFINSQIAESERIIRTEATISDHQEGILALSLNDLQKLSPLEKNTNLNDLQISQGRLERINPTINRDYMAYIQLIRSQDKLAEKLGETLQQISLDYIYPIVRMHFISENNEERKLTFDYAKIYDNPLIINGLNKSYYYRNIYLSQMRLILNTADSLLMNIEQELRGKEILLE